MMVEVIPLVCRMWRDALERTQGVNRREWLSELAAIDREFTEWPDGREPVRRRPRRVAQAPDVPAPFFAGRSGALPPTGSATVAGVRLPKGTRRPSVAPAYWISDEAVDDAASLAGWPGSSQVRGCGRCCGSMTRIPMSTWNSPAIQTASTASQ